MTIHLLYQKGQIKHLDEAYVYLGRSRTAQADYAGAQHALDGLDRVPGVSPRILQLWQLYAETHRTPPPGGLQAPAAGSP